VVNVKEDANSVITVWMKEIFPIIYDIVSREGTLSPK